MDEVIYSSEFKDVIELAKEKGLFLGSGNPNAKIIFIGKEAAIDREKAPSQYEREYSKNHIEWDLNFSTIKQFADIDDWFCLNCTPTYNPLFPYKGQKNTVESRNKEGIVIRGKGGTSRTWYNYQKIIDAVYYNHTPSEFINYHEKAFISEINEITGPYSNTIPKSLRRESIEKRKELFQNPFFKEFPISIIAVGHYARDFNIDLEDIFKMKYNEELSKKLSEGMNKEYINVHYNDLENPTKLLIHTNQLSMVSNELIFRLGKVCKDFLNL